jgi:Spy/CpxP family protein refolding chaperone
MRADDHAQMEPSRRARAELLHELARGVRAGAVDRARVDARLGELVASVQRVRPVMEQTTNELHRILDAGQREDLVDALKDHGHEERDRRRDALRAIAGELDLSDDQRDRIKSAARAELGPRRVELREKMGEMRSRLEAHADAFRSERFDARALEVGKHAPEATHEFARVATRMTELALPVLDPNQRLALADWIERRAVLP